MAGTLPHRKYYNLEAYEKYKEAKAASKGIKKSAKKVRVCCKFVLMFVGGVSWLLGLASGCLLQVSRCRQEELGFLSIECSSGAKSKQHGSKEVPRLPASCLPCVPLLLTPLIAFKLLVVQAFSV